MLGCIQPISSPMMKRMLGLPACPCAMAGALKASNAIIGVNRLQYRVFMIQVLAVLSLSTKSLFTIRPHKRVPSSQHQFMRTVSKLLTRRAMRFRQVDLVSLWHDAMWSTAIRRKLLDMPRQSARAPQIHSFEQFMQRPGDQD